MGQWGAAGGRESPETEETEGGATVTVGKPIKHSYERERPFWRPAPEERRIVRQPVQEPVRQPAREPVREPAREPAMPRAS